MNEVQNQIAEQAHLRNNPVIQVCEAIKNHVEEFERELDEEHEVGVRLASFGAIAVFHPEQIGFSKPNVITFYALPRRERRFNLFGTFLNSISFSRR
jgi:hypothetical protein